MQTKQNAIDVNEHITNIIISQLEKGVIPWEQSYLSSVVPQNAVTGKIYRGVNTWLLAMPNYVNNYFLSMKQIKDLNGTVIKDEKANQVIYWSWTDVLDKQSEQSAKVPFLRLGYVYNISQCEGLLIDPPAVEIKSIEERFQLCENIVTAMQKMPEIKIKGKVNSYNPFEDCITIGPVKQFATVEDYYTALFCFLIHSTGHPKRLNRKELLLMDSFSGDPFSIEELIAELGAAFLKFHCGILLANKEPNEMRIEGWLKKFKKNRRLIIYACSLAQKAVDYILNITFEEGAVEEVVTEHNLEEANA